MRDKHRLSLFSGLVDHHKTREHAWQGTTAAHPLKTIEARQYTKLRRVLKTDAFTNLLVETWSDDTVHQWLQHKDPPAAPPVKRDIGDLQGTIRLLICHEDEVQMDDHKTEQSRYFMSLDSFNAAEEHLDLPTQTLPNLGNRWGINSREFVDSGKEGGMTLGESSSFSLPHPPDLIL
jgi:hypothetical protein